MNKDKLKKEVRDYLRQQFGLNGGGIVSCNLEELLLHFAEPREKRIAELEKENAELKTRVENEEPSCDVIDALAYALYYSANPESEMCIPNCAYIQAEKMFEKWKEEK